jgi:hypothetical protein
MPPPIRRVLQKKNVFLTDGISRTLVEATLLSHLTVSHMQDVETVWRITQKNLLAKLPPTSRPEHTHWDWRAKLQALEDVGIFYGIERDGMMQGLICLRQDKQGRLAEQKGLPLTYVDYLETAPWNLPSLTSQPHFRGVGTTLLKVAIQHSLAQGWEGRIGLHSLPQAESFYRHFGMVDCGADNDYYDLTYFETLPQKAIELGLR